MCLGGLESGFERKAIYRRQKNVDFFLLFLAKLLRFEKPSLFLVILQVSLLCVLLAQKSVSSGIKNIYVSGSSFQNPC